VSLVDMKEMGFPYRMSRLQLADLLEERYPDHKWDRIFLLKGKYSQQKRLEAAVTSLFPVSVVTFHLIILLNHENRNRGKQSKRTQERKRT